MFYSVVWVVFFMVFITGPDYGGRVCLHLRPRVLLGFKVESVFIPDALRCCGFVAIYLWLL